MRKRQTGRTHTKRTFGETCQTARSRTFTRTSEVGVSEDYWHEVRHKKLLVNRPQRPSKSGLSLRFDRREIDRTELRPRVSPCYVESSRDACRGIRPGQTKTYG